MEFPDQCVALCSLTECSCKALCRDAATCSEGVCSNACWSAIIVHISCGVVMGRLMNTPFMSWRVASRRSYPPPPLYKLRPCPSYSRRRDRINLGPNFNSVPNVVQPHKTWVW